MAVGDCTYRLGRVTGRQRREVGWRKVLVYARFHTEITIKHCHMISKILNWNVQLMITDLSNHRRQLWTNIGDIYIITFWLLMSSM